MTIIPLSTHDAPLSKAHRVPLKPHRVQRAKAAYTTRRVRWDEACALLVGELKPRSGDLVLARIERIGQHKRIELACGRRAHLHVGDEVILCYGSRYAPDQFEAVTPDNLGECDMVAAGGVAAHCRERHASLKAPTRIAPIGLLADAAGQVLNLSRYALPVTTPTSRPLVYGVAGSLMNAGKTTTAAMVLRGLRSRGLKVGAVKVTGTGAGCDRWVYEDAGADSVLDFTDLGEPSTYQLPAARVEALFSGLVDLQASAGMDAVVVEVADGVYQAETAALLASPLFRRRCEGVFFAAADPLGATSGVDHLQQLGLPVLGVSGTLTASPLAMREAAQRLEPPVLTKEALSAGTWLKAYYPAAQREEA
ncbi:hypothetical protein [Motiliproteus sp. SC1-56]|uniref:hypothetical protein n=1 Tax=Motiliproteus sp. SC1-56 TaxID=2799565 RepID=UPI001A8E1BDC|nr:hypothetical protein [Motiliproteus sp. SC1-56]